METVVVKPTKAKTGKKGQKFGRKGRRPSHHRYNASKRWIKNKARKVAKQIKKFPNYKPYNLSGSVKVLVDEMLASNR